LTFAAEPGAQLGLGQLHRPVVMGRIIVTNPRSKRRPGGS
jgi:hypothetical protein